MYTIDSYEYLKMALTSSRESVSLLRMRRIAIVALPRREIEMELSGYFPGILKIMYL